MRLPAVVSLGIADRSAFPQLTDLAIVATSRFAWGGTMKSVSARDAKYGFGRLIDMARAEPVTVAKHGRPVVVVVAVEEFERLTAAAGRAAKSPTSEGNRQ